MAYDLINITNTSGVLGFVQQTNTILMNGWMGVVFLMVIAAVTFMGFLHSTRDVRKAAMGSSFISLTLSLLLLTVSLVPFTAFLVALILTALSVGFSFMGG